QRDIGPTAPANALLLLAWPREVTVEEIERTLSVDRVRPDEELDLGPVADPETRLVEMAHFRVFVRDGFIGRHAVEMTAFDHEGARRDERGHLRVVERASEVELEDLVLAGPHIAVGASRRGVLPHPLVEVGRADRETVLLDERRNPHRGLAAVGKPIEGDALGVDPRERAEPFDDRLVLGNDRREERLSDRVRFALKRPEAVPEDIEVLRREGHEAAPRELGREGFVVVVILLADDRLRPSLEPVLADDDRTAIARDGIVREEEDAVGDHIGKDVEHDLVTGPTLAFVALARTGARGRSLEIEAADHLVAEALAVGRDRTLEGLDRARVEILEEFAANVGALDEKRLVVTVDLVDLSPAPGLGIDRADGTRRFAERSEPRARRERIEELPERFFRSARTASVAAHVDVDRLASEARAIGRFARALDLARCAFERR